MRIGKWKFLKIFVDLAIFFCLIILLFLTLIQNNGNYFIDLLQKRIFENKTKNIYLLTKGKTDIDFLSGYLSLENLNLEIKNDNFLTLNKKPCRLAEIKIKKLKIFGISWINLILKNKISAEKISLDGGKISYFYFPKNCNSKKKKRRKKSLDLSFSIFSLNNISFNYFKGSFVNPSLVMNENILKLKNFQIKTSESVPLIHSISFLSPEFISSHISIFLRKRSYYLKINSINLSSAKKSGSINGIYFSPVKISEVSNYTSIKIKKVKLLVADLFSIPGEGKINAEKVSLISPKLKIYHIRKSGKKSKKKLFPHEFIKKIGFNFNIRDLDLKDGSFIYSEKISGEKQSESVYITGINGNVTEMSNFRSPDFNPKDPFLSINLSGRLMNRSTLKITFKIPVLTKTVSYYLSGKLNRTYPRIFNHFLSRNSKIRIDNGILDSLKLHLWANPLVAKGTLSIKYRNLKISILKKRDYKKKRKFYSFLANTIIRKNNYQKNGKFKKGKIDYPKDPKSSFLNYLWKAILSGIKSSIRF